jgi:uncharacterized protein
MLPEPVPVSELGQAEGVVRGLRGFVHRHPLATFLVLAYGLSWTWWVPMALSGARVRVGSGHPSHFPGLLGPALAAVIVTMVRDGMAGMRDLLRRMCRWHPRAPWSVAAAVVSPLGTMLAVMLVLKAAGRSPRVADFGRMNGLPELSPIVLWLVLWVWNGFGEEAGWRGFALPHLQKLYGPLGGTLMLAAAWAGWHAPMFFILETYRSLGLAMVPGFVLSLAAGAVLLTWLYHRAGDSILAAALWHGSFNLVTGTQAAQGILAAVVSTMVMFWGTALAVIHIRARRRGAPSVLV